MWKNSNDLLAAIHDAHQRLKSKETDAISAHAEARLLSSATRVMAISLEHARLTSRLREGSAELPIMSLGTEEVAGISLEGSTAPRLPEANPS